MNLGNSRNRRDFMKAGLATITGAAAILKPSRNTKAAESEQSAIIYRTLGKTGLKLPIVSMGTGDTNNPNLVKAALDAGIVLLATSSYYSQGQNEKMLGEVVKDRKRDSYMIMTSALPDGVDHKAGLFTKESKTEPFIDKFEGSLQRLNLDYVDICILPFAAKRESVFFEPLLRAMEKIKKQGKARFVGIATHSYEPEAIRAAVETKVYDVALTAYNFRRQNHLEIENAITFASESGLGIIAMKTMAGAYWDKERKNPINSKAALKWVLRNKNVHTAVPGITTFDQIQADISVMKDLSLSEDEKKDLKISFHQAPNDPYCQQCGQCIPQCRKHLDIPTLMRSYMYTYGYKNLAHAKETFAYTGITDIPCAHCDYCTVTCALNHDIKKRIIDIGRLNDVPEDFLV